MSDARLTGLQKPPQEPHPRHERTLLWFMRAMAAVWIAKGLANWLAILDHDPWGGPPFTALPMGARATLVVFAVLDLVAGVGLWLTSTWGGVMWLLAVMSALLVDVLVPSGSAWQGVGAGLQIAAVAVYIGLSWLASREG